MAEKNKPSKELAEQAALREKIFKMPDGPAKEAERNRLKAMTDSYKSKKLLEIANRRVPLAVSRVRIIGNLKAYRPTAEQSAKIIQELASAVTYVESKLTSADDAKGQLSFSL